MPANVTVNTEKAKAQLRAYAKNVNTSIQEIRRKAAVAIESAAKSEAPVDDGTLRASIHSTHNVSFSKVRVEADYAAYVEFGTGAKAEEYLSSQSPELREYARQFFVSGKGRMPAQPFLFPAFEGVQVKMQAKMGKSLQQSARSGGFRLDLVDLFILGGPVDLPNVQTALFIRQMVT